jgi:WD40 repeat protein
MFFSKLKILAGVLLAVAATGLGTGALVYRAAAGAEEPPQMVTQVGQPRQAEPVISGLDHSSQEAIPRPPGSPAAPASPWRERSTLEAGKERCMSVAFSPDGRLLAVGSLDGTVGLWDVAAAREVRRFNAEGQVAGVAFSPDGRYLAAGGGQRGKTGEIRLWDTHTGKEINAIRGRADLIVSVAFSPDGRTLAYGSRDGTLCLWDLAREQRRVDSVGAAITVFCTAYSPDGKFVATAGGDELVREGNKPGNLRLWDAATGKEVRAIQGHTNTVTSVAFSPDGRLVASGGFDKLVCLWDTATGQERLCIKGHTGIVRCVAFSPDGKSLASGSFDGTVKVWDVHSGQERASLQGPGGVMAVAFSPDGRLLAGAGGKPGKAGQVILWELATRTSASPISRLERLLDELVKSKRSDEQIVEALYLATLARLPAETEVKSILAHLDRKDRREAFKDVLWALINCREFIERLTEWDFSKTGKIIDLLRQVNEQSP